MALSSQKGRLIAVIGDEDTCTGFLLGGIGEINKKRESNFLVVDKNTSVPDIEEAFRSFLKRDDIAIILIVQNVPLNILTNVASLSCYQYNHMSVQNQVAEMIRHVIDSHVQPIPAVLEIPSKECPYDASKDSILRRAKGMFAAEDLR